MFFSLASWSYLQMSFTKEENGCWNNILCFTIVLVRIKLKENICKIFSKTSKSFWMKNDHCVKVLLSHCTHVFDPWWSLVLFLMNICPIRTGTRYEQICLTPILRIYYCYPEMRNEIITDSSTEHKNKKMTPWGNGIDYRDILLINLIWIIVLTAMRQRIHIFVLVAHYRITFYIHRIIRCISLFHI